MAMMREAVLARSRVTTAVPARRLLPVDGLMAVYNVFLATLWLGTVSETRVGWVGVALHLAGGMLPALLVRLPVERSRSARFVRDLYALLLLPVFWAEIDILFPLRHAGTFDVYVHGFEQALFGTQLAETWMPSAPQLLLSEIMHLSYFGYYAAIYLPPLLMAVAGRTRETQDMVLRLMAGYLTCYAIYLLFPVDGPHFRHEPYDGDLTRGFFYGLVAATQAAGDSRGCAFPSSHVVGAVSAAYLAWRWLPRPIAWLLGVEALGVVFSTVYTQNHYAVDAIFGATWAMALQLLILPALLKRSVAAARRPAHAARSGTEGLLPVLWTRHGRRRGSWAA